MRSIRVFESLMRGKKKSVRRASRLILQELIFEAMRAHPIPLPKGLDDASALHDLLGGPRREVAQAIVDLTDPDDRAISFEGESPNRTLTILAFDRYAAAAVDDAEGVTGSAVPVSAARAEAGRIGGLRSAAARQAKAEAKRSNLLGLLPKQNEANASPSLVLSPSDSLSPDLVISADLQASSDLNPQVDSAREGASERVTIDEFRSGPTPTRAQPEQTGSKTRSPKGVRTTMPEDFGVWPELEAICRTEGLPNPHVVLRDFRDKAAANRYLYVDWRAAFRVWMRSELTRRSYPRWDWEAEERARNRPSDVAPKAASPERHAEMRTLWRKTLAEFRGPWRRLDDDGDELWPARDEQAPAVPAVPLGAAQ